ncbi:MAG: hypothetical protein JXX14_17065 [Deltaproteobacteria bacterium]|nr:hypothetical protein [Deltaproteobacteria bacterium]
MLKTVIWLISIIIICGCETKIPDRSTPEGAFSRLSRCIDAASTECLFWELDNETRWTVSSIHKILKETRQTVEKSYPADATLRSSVYGKWQQEALAQTDVAMFDTLCKKHNCLKLLARGFGAITARQIKNNTAEIHTVRDAAFELRKSKGQWGIVLLQDVLEGEKIRLSDSLKQVRRNANEYEQQRLATGKTK